MPSGSYISLSVPTTSAATRGVQGDEPFRAPVGTASVYNYSKYLELIVLIYTATQSTQREKPTSPYTSSLARNGAGPITRRRRSHAKPPDEIIDTSLPSASSGTDPAPSPEHFLPRARVLPLTTRAATIENPPRRPWSCAPFPAHVNRDTLRGADAGTGDKKAISSLPPSAAAIYGELVAEFVGLRFELSILLGQKAAGSPPQKHWDPIQTRREKNLRRVSLIAPTRALNITTLCIWTAHWGSTTHIECSPCTPQALRQPGLCPIYLYWRGRIQIPYRGFERPSAKGAFAYVSRGSVLGSSAGGFSASEPWRQITPRVEYGQSHHRRLAQRSSKIVRESASRKGGLPVWEWSLPETNIICAAFGSQVHRGAGRRPRGHPCCVLCHVARC